jgi:hypothetical protein
VRCLWLLGLTLSAHCVTGVSPAAVATMVELLLALQHTTWLCGGGDAMTPEEDGMVLGLAQLYMLHPSIHSSSASTHFIAAVSAMMPVQHSPSVRALLIASMLACTCLTHLCSHQMLLLCGWVLGSCLASLASAHDTASVLDDVGVHERHAHLLLACSQDAVESLVAQAKRYLEMCVWLLSQSDMLAEGFTYATT